MADAQRDERADGEAVDIDAIIAELHAPAEEPIVATLWSIVTGMLATYQLRYEPLDGTAGFVRMRGVAANYDVLLSVDEAQQIVRCSTLMPVRIAEPRRAALCELLNHLNYTYVGLGAFDMDPEDGQPRWRQSFDVEGGLLGETMVLSMLNVGVACCDRFWAAILAVGVLELTPEAALARFAGE